MTLCLVLVGNGKVLCGRGAKPSREEGFASSCQVQTSLLMNFDTVGTISGFDIDLIREDMKRLGYDVEVVDMDFSGYCQRCKRDRWMLLLLASKTEERLKTSIFLKIISDPLM